MEKENYISYYELLTIIKDCEQIWEYPKVYWHNNYRDKVLYVPTFDSVSGDLEGYHLKNRNLENDDIRYWLSECMLESSMFDKCIEISGKIEEDKKIEKLEKYYDDDLEEYIVETYINGVNYKEIFKSKYDEMMINKINEIIVVLNEMRKDK